METEDNWVSISNLCLSGGAIGADSLWGMTAGRAGHAVKHFSFSGHKISVPIEEIVILSSERLSEADPFLSKANETLKRHWLISNKFTSNLLRRNYFQVAWTETVYAVATIKNGLVEGGTSWACQMFIDRHDGKACPVYVFDQDVASWYKWEGLWTLTDAIPEPRGVWTGIGTRNLNANGKKAIKDLMHYV